VMIWSGRPVLPGRVERLQAPHRDMNTLIAVGTGAAYLYSLVATFAPGVFAGAGHPADVYYESVSASSR